MNLASRQAMIAYGFGFRFWTFLDVLSKAFATMLLPLRQSTYLSLTHISPNVSWENVSNLLGMILYLGLITLSFHRRRFLSAFALLFFLVGLIPYLNLIPNSILFAERFLYLPSLGLLLAAALVCQHLPPLPRRAMVFLSSFLLLLYVCWTPMRAALWKNPATYWGDVQSHFPNSTIVRLKLGDALVKEGKWTGACRSFQVAYHLGGTHPKIRAAVFQNWGVCQARKGDFRQAANLLDQALGTKSATADAYLQAAVAHRKVGNFRRSREIFALGKRRFSTHQNFKK